MPIVRVQSVPHMQRSSPNASMTRSTGSQISSYGNGWCDIVQAPLIFTLTFSYWANASSLGRSAQTSAGTGGRAGCSRPRWSMTMTVSRCRWMCGSPLSRMPQQSKLTGKACLAAAAKVRFKPGYRQLVWLRSKRYARPGLGVLRLCQSGRTGDLRPGLKGLGPGSSILIGGDVIAAEVEQIVDPLMGGEEAVRLAGWFEPLHLR